MPPAPPLPSVTVVLDRHDDVLHTRTALAAHHPPSGRVTLHPGPGTTSETGLAHDLLVALGKPSLLPGRFPGGRQPAWEAAAAWMTALPVTRLTVLRAHRLTARRTVRLAEPARVRLAAYLDHRTRRWPCTANPYFFVTRRTALTLQPVSRPWLYRCYPAFSFRLREDRIVDEVQATAADVPVLCRMFGLSVQAAARYSAAATTLPS